MLYKKLYSNFGPQLWWPVTDKGDTKPTYKKRRHLTENQKLEICIGSLLTQNTDWRNVMKALENLNRAKMLDCGKIIRTRQERIAALVRPSGYYNQKAKKLKLFCKYIEKNYNSNLNSFLKKPVKELREELLSIHGVGRETADSIMLYAAGKPVFVVDTYTKRFLGRFYAKANLSYVEVQGFFEKQLPKDAGLFNEFHALIVEFCKNHCRKKPLCDGCPLNEECLNPDR